MNKKIHTKVDQKLFSGAATIVHDYQVDEGYAYKIEHKGKQYILKGSEIKLTRLEAGADPSQIVFTKESFMEVPIALENVFQEYYFTKFIANISPHFSAPRMIDYVVEPAQYANSFSNLYIEVIFDYEGQSLDSCSPMAIDKAYNFMRQSANALCTLHLTKVTHPDINPQSMVISTDNSQETLKIINIGSTCKFTMTSLSESMQDMFSKVTSYKQRYSPPEIIKAEGLSSNDSIQTIGNTDVYCWAMTFYQLLLGESDSNLCKEVELYKKATSKEYTDFINLLKKKIKEKHNPADLLDRRKKEFIEENLLKALNYDARERPMMCEIAKEMRRFERKEGIKLGYHTIELEYQKNIMNSLGISESSVEEIKAITGPEEVKISRIKASIPKDMSLPKEEVNKKINNQISARKNDEKQNSTIMQVQKLCKECNRSIKVKLQCDHTMCTSCILDYVVSKFMNGKPYNYQVVCKKCNKKVKLSNLY